MKNLPYKPIKVRCKVEDSLQIKPYIMKKDDPIKRGSNIQRYFYDAYPCNYDNSSEDAIFTVFIKGYMDVHEIISIDKNEDPEKPLSKTNIIIAVVVLFILLCVLILFLKSKSCKASKNDDSNGLRQNSNMSSNPLITESPIVTIPEENGMIT